MGPCTMSYITCHWERKLIFYTGEKIIHFLILDHNWFDVGLKESTVFDVERNSLKKSKLVSFSQCGNSKRNTVIHILREVNF